MDKHVQTNIRALLTVLYAILPWFCPIRKFQVLTLPEKLHLSLAWLYVCLRPGSNYSC